VLNQQLAGHHPTLGRQVLLVRLEQGQLELPELPAPLVHPVLEQGQPVLVAQLDPG
jgi:hypothetical protein